MQIKNLAYLALFAGLVSTTAVMAAQQQTVQPRQASYDLGLDDELLDQDDDQTAMRSAESDARASASRARRSREHRHPGGFDDDPSLRDRDDQMIGVPGPVPGPIPAPVGQPVGSAQAPGALQN